MHLSAKHRLILTYTAELLVGLLLFSMIALAVIDRTMRGSVDAHLNAASGAIEAIVIIDRGNLTLDAEDRAQFLDLLGVDYNGVLRDRDGRIVASNVSNPPPFDEKALRVSHPVTLGHGESDIRARLLPIAKNGTTYGSLVVWRSIGWIVETDHRIELAFLGGALLISALAAIIGGSLTQQALDLALERQRRFTADASHELRAPLAVVMAETDFSLGRDDRATSEYLRSLRAIRDEAQRMETLVDDLLWIARSDLPDRRCAWVDIGELIAEHHAPFERMIEASGARFSFETKIDAIAWIDEIAFPRAIFAVMHNATRFAKKSVALRVSTNAQYVDIEISDDGMGFSAEGLLHATDRFWREKNARTGNGLGLAVAQSVAEHCGGRLLLSNRSEGGSVVTFRLRRGKLNAHLPKFHSG